MQRQDHELIEAALYLVKNEGEYLSVETIDGTKGPKKYLHLMLNHNVDALIWNRSLDLNLHLSIMFGSN